MRLFFLLSDIKKMINHKITRGNTVYKKNKTRNVTVTLSGILAASHLVGSGELNKGFKGTKKWEEIVDGFGTSVLKYLYEMADFDLTRLLGGIDS